MAVKRIGEKIKYFICQSNDVKPAVSSVPAGSELYEFDTNKIYINTGDSWIEKMELDNVVDLD